MWTRVKIEAIAGNSGLLFFNGGECEGGHEVVSLTSCGQLAQLEVKWGDKSSARNQTEHETHAGII